MMKTQKRVKRRGEEWWGDTNPFRILERISTTVVPLSTL
jgi:hypothetical protein